MPRAPVFQNGDRFQVLTDFNGRKDTPKPKVIFHDKKKR